MEKSYLSINKTILETLQEKLSLQNNNMKEYLEKKIDE